MLSLEVLLKSDALARGLAHFGSQMSSESMFGAFSRLSRRMVPRVPQKAYSERFRALAAEWSQEGLRRPILSAFALWPPNGPRRASEGLFGASSRLHCSMKRFSRCSRASETKRRVHFSEINPKSVGIWVVLGWDFNSELATPPPPIIFKGGGGVFACAAKTLKLTDTHHVIPVVWCVSGSESWEQPHLG